MVGRVARLGVCVSLYRSRVGRATWNQEEGISDAVWQSRTSVSGRSASRGVSTGLCSVGGSLPPRRGHRPRRQHPPSKPRDRHHSLRDQSRWRQRQRRGGFQCCRPWRRQWRRLQRLFARWAQDQYDVRAGQWVVHGLPGLRIEFGQRQLNFKLVDQQRRPTRGRSWPTRQRLANQSR